jgi:hypothetical protein
MLKIASLVLALGLTAVGAGQTFAQGCPANSHASGSIGGTTQCRCNGGYVMSGGQCVPAR